MASQIESGINTYVGNFRLLINICTGFGQSYNPQNPALQIDAMEIQLTAVQTAVNNVDTLLPTWLTVVGVRQDKFDPLIRMATRVQALAIALNMSSTIVTRIKEIVRKLRGVRAHKLTEKDMTDANGEPVRHVSVSQTSFNEKIEHFNQLIGLVASQPTYTPTEPDLSVASMTAMLNEMKESNNAVMAAIVPLTTARQERDALLYAPKTGMMATALLVKEYVKAVFGANSPQYKEVRILKFRKR